MKYLEYNMRDSRKILYKICMLLIWGLFLYSTVIQYKYFEIPHAMIIIGILILLFFLLCIDGEQFSILTLFPAECVWMIGFMAYMLTFVQVSAIHPLNHLKLCITSMEYLFVLLVIVYINSRSETDSIQLLLVITAILLGVILLCSPVLYTTGRYSISRELNPNYLGMCLTSGIWAVLYFQQKGKLPVTIALLLTALLEYCTLLTGSRKAFIASVIVFLLWTVICYYPSLDNVPISKRILYCIVALVLIVALFYWFGGEYSNSIIAQRMERLKDQGADGERAQFYLTGWNLFKKNPIFGIGFTGFASINGKDSHATIVEVPVSGGVIGALIYFSAYFISIGKCIRIYRICKRSVYLRDELKEIRMILILWVVMLFYSSCIIHPFQLLSHISFGIIFGKSESLRRRIVEGTSQNDIMRNRRPYVQSIYIKN